MSGTPKTVLLIDDDTLFLAIAADFLRSKALVDTHSASNGQEAIRLLTGPARNADLIVCDLNMPDVDGIELIDELGTMSCRVPLIIVTGALPAVSVSAEIIARGYALNLIATLRKPVSYDALWACAAAVLAPGLAAADRVDATAA